MKDIEFRISTLTMLSNKCNDLLKCGSSMPTSSFRLREGDKLFGKITLHAISYMRIWPQKYEELDPGSLASIARNIIEIHNVLNP